MERIRLISRMLWQNKMETIEDKLDKRLQEAADKNIWFKVIGRMKLNACRFRHTERNAWFCALQKQTKKSKQHQKRRGVGIESCMCLMKVDMQKVK